MTQDSLSGRRCRGSCSPRGWCSGQARGLQSRHRGHSSADPPSRGSHCPPAAPFEPALPANGTKLRASVLFRGHRSCPHVNLLTSLHTFQVSKNYFKCVCSLTSVPWRQSPVAARSCFRRGWHREVEGQGQERAEMPRPTPLCRASSPSVLGAGSEPPPGVPASPPHRVGGSVLRAGLQGPKLTLAHVQTLTSTGCPG